MLMSVFIVKLFSVIVVLSLIFRMGMHKGVDIAMLKHMIKYGMNMDAVSKKYT